MKVTFVIKVYYAFKDELLRFFFLFEQSCQSHQRILASQYGPDLQLGLRKPHATISTGHY